MNERYTALYVPVEGDVRLVEMTPETSYRQTRALLDDGYLEAISTDDWSAYLDEEGKLKSLPYNARANDLAASLGWRGMPGDFLCGPLIFVGPPDRDGYDTSVPERIIDLAAPLIPQ